MKPRTLFIDTGAFIAKELVRDQYHSTALKVWAEIARGNITIVTSDHVFDESATLLARRIDGHFAASWGQDLLNLELMRRLTADRDELLSALTLMKKFSDQSVSFTDCLSFVLMKREKIRHAFTFDHHFAVAGFRVWPGT